MYDATISDQSATWTVTRYFYLKRMAPVNLARLTAPFVGEPETGNTETFISIGQLGSLYEAEALVKYIKTRFVRSLLGALKTTQDITPEKWQYVPMQNFTPVSDIDWSLSVNDIDELLYTKYALTANERDFVRKKVQKME